MWFKHPNKKPLKILQVSSVHKHITNVFKDMQSPYVCGPNIILPRYQQIAMLHATQQMGYLHNAMSPMICLQIYLKAER